MTTPPNEPRYEGPQSPGWEPQPAYSALPPQPPPPQPPYPYYGGPPPGPPPSNNNGKVIAAAAIVVVALLVAVIFLALNTRKKPGPDSPPVADGTSSTSAPSTTTATPTTTRPPPPLTAGQCVAPTTESRVHPAGNCDSGAYPYRVYSVEYRGTTCGNPASPWVTESGYRVCLDTHVLKTYCYKFPESRGWVVPSTCKVPGSVHIVDLVPGGINGDRCTTAFEWNRWFSFKSPVMAVCVKTY